MKGFVTAFFALVALSHAAPQGGVEFTAKEYEALQQALGDRIPVAIQSAIRVLASVESNPSDFVVLNFNGLSSGPSARTGAGSDAAPAAAGGIAIARTGSASTSDDDDVAELFSEVAEDAVDDVQDAAEDAAEADEEAEPAAANRTGLAAEAEEEVAEEIENEVTSAQVAAAIESARRKRQNDEFRQRQANTLSTALSLLGLQIGGNLGRYLDSIHNANLKLIENMENTGEIVLDQVDQMNKRRIQQKER